MEIRSSLWRGTPSSGPVGGAHRRLSAHRRSPRSVRARAVRGLRESGWLSEDDEVILLNTGTGLKYPHTMPQDGR